MTKLRVFARRPTPLDDLNIVTINDYNTAFNVDLYQQLDNKEPTLVHAETFTPGEITPPTPEPEPPIVEEGLLYDSNVDIKWDKIPGEFVKENDIYGEFKPGTKYIRTKASGQPRMYLYKATKEICLEHDGKYGRLYFGVCNYASRLEVEFKLENPSHGFSAKLRNRHQYADVVKGAPDDKRQGGQGCGIHVSEIDNDLEVVHGTEIGGPQAKISPKLEINKYYKLKFSQFDKNGKIHIVDELDFNDGKGFVKINEGDVAAPKQFFNKTDFEEFSEFWIRLNADNGGKLYFKNLKLYSL